MKYSVVIPVYLREESHKETVENTLTNIRQMSRDMFLIIIDDGSPLNTSFLEKHANLFVKHKKNKGISASWNTGKNLSPSEYVAIVNDDVNVPISWLPVLSSAFENKKTGVSAPYAGGNHVQPQKFSDLFIENYKFYPGYCFMLKKDRFFEDFDEQFNTNCGDVDYWHRIRQKGLKCIRVGFSVWHKEGGVLHKMDYDKITSESLKKFEKKWKFNPQKEYYS